jgi:hypothetical protein
MKLHEENMVQMRRNTKYGVRNAINSLGFGKELAVIDNNYDLQGLWE